MRQSQELGRWLFPVRIIGASFAHTRARKHHKCANYIGKNIRGGPSRPEFTIISDGRTLRRRCWNDRHAFKVERE